MSDETEALTNTLKMYSKCLQHVSIVREIMLPGMDWTEGATRDYFRHSLYRVISIKTNEPTGDCLVELITE